jgi:hypothetical protein
VARVGSSDHDAIFCILVQGRSLGGENDIAVKGFVGGSGLPLFAGVGPEARGEPHGLCGDRQVAEILGKTVESAQASTLARY